MIQVRNQDQENFLSLPLARLYCYPYDHRPQSAIAVEGAETYYTFMEKTKWVGCPKHSIQYIPSEKPRESPTTTVA
jgi:hypothetical protein